MKKKLMYLRSCFTHLSRVIAGLGLVCLSMHTSMAQETPIGPKWWPSEWGADDQRGAANRITPQKVLSAASLITKGKIYQLGRQYNHGMPLLGKRVYSLTVPGLPSATPLGTNQIVSNSEMVAAEIGQVGTQFDGLGHVGVRVNGEDRFYNGLKLSPISETATDSKNLVLKRSEQSLPVEYYWISQPTKALGGSRLIILSALETLKAR